MYMEHVDISLAFCFALWIACHSVAYMMIGFPGRWSSDIGQGIVDRGDSDWHMHVL